MSSSRQAHLTYLVGQGKVLPKVQAIKDYPVPTHNKRIASISWYEWFLPCPNFAHIAEPLTNLLAKNAKFVSTENCQAAFENL